ncbi:hypothetical protein PUW24_02690 [Paenibacillus urinalis]|uniref:Secreted protein n=1 Tax=Paenibacillus urinalis TaxID=521520 RepID=A0ABY7XA36_9BACL|nr:MULTISPECIES: hypothetical protein [Paenibacillus]WDH97907.1 hypothetical protein PUW24_02690 [Paenibacillus urinalis]WDI01586.1 hypothetical protein PUW25_20425 [Paenibacillus urinalis]GAK43457.1 hypothetical protein TCA2_5955 [Paenibacillus sp. TCA20]
MGGLASGAPWTDWVPIVVALRLLDSTVITRLKSDGKDERSASSLQFRPLRSSARLYGSKTTSYWLEPQSSAWGMGLRERAG